MRSPFAYFLIILLAWAAEGAGQDTVRVALAEPFSWKMQRGDANETVMAGQRMGSFEILGITDSGKNELNLLMVALDTGLFYLPLKTGISGEGGYPVTVKAPNAESVREYSPVKEPVFSRTESTSYGWIAPVVMAVTLLAGLLYWFGNRKKTKPVMPVITGPGGLAMLQEVRDNWASGKLDSLQLGEGLVNCLQLHFGIPVKKSTRQLLKLIRRQYAHAESPSLEKVLGQTDGWRFGKQVAQPADGASAAACLEELFLKTKTNSKGNF